MFYAKTYFIIIIHLIFNLSSYLLRTQFTIYIYKYLKLWWRQKSEKIKIFRTKIKGLKKKNKYSDYQLFT